ncbi:hypothetical protein HKX48_004215 [Thoreauomyces humboldtii]|nr:hypothetical protein HKX48_004215 [Thoreauomyces humboldtii]
MASTEVPTSPSLENHPLAGVQAETSAPPSGSIEDQLPPLHVPRKLARSASSPFLRLDFAVEKELASHFIIAALRKEDGNSAFLSLLTTGKASLFLPLGSSLVHVTDTLNNTFFEHHVFVRNPDNESQMMSLGGIRALIKDQRLIIIGDRPMEHELLQKGADGTDKALSIWDTIDVETTTIDQHPSIELLSETADDVSLNDTTVIKVHLMRRAIMHEDLAARTPLPSKPPPPPPRALSTASTRSQITYPNISFDNIASVPISLLNNIPSLFTKATPTPVLDDNLPEDLLSDPFYQVFATRMKEPKCVGYVSDIQRYFASLEASRTPVSSDEIASYHHAFMRRFMIAWQRDAMTDPAQTEAIGKGLDAYMLAQGYRTYFVSILNEEQLADLLIHRKISLLSTIDFGLEQLGIPVSSDTAAAVRETVKLAGLQLLRAERATTPSTKLTALVAAHNHVTDRVHLCFPDGDAEGEKGADVLVPFLIYVVVKTNPPRLVSTLKYISKFLHAGRAEGHSTYAWTNVSAVQSFLETLDVTAFGLDAEMEECYSLKPGNSNHDNLIVLPTDHSLLLAPEAASSSPAASRASGSNASGALDSIGQRISGLWPFRGGTPEPHLPLPSFGTRVSSASDPPPASPKSPDLRLWSRLKSAGSK